MKPFPMVFLGHLCTQNSFSLPLQTKKKNNEPKMLPDKPKNCTIRESFAKPRSEKCAQLESRLIKLGSEKRAQLGSLVKFPEKVHN